MKMVGNQKGWGTTIFAASRQLSITKSKWLCVSQSFWNIFFIFYFFFDAYIDIMENERDTKKTIFSKHNTIGTLYTF